MLNSVDRVGAPVVVGSRGRIVGRRGCRVSPGGRITKAREYAAAGRRVRSMVALAGVVTLGCFEKNILRMVGWPR